MELRSRTTKRAIHCLGLLATAALMSISSMASAQDDNVPRRIDHTPWLGIQIVQKYKPVRLVQMSNDESRAFMKRERFILIFPTPPSNIGEDELVYQIAASRDKDSLFGKARDGIANRIDPDVPLPFYFQPATGMADTEAGTGTLILNEEGHNHLIGLRLGPDRYRPRYSVRYIGEVGNEGSTEHPVSEQREPLYLVIFHDKDHDEKMELGEYELLELRF